MAVKKKPAPKKAAPKKTVKPAAKKVVAKAAPKKAAPKKAVAKPAAKPVAKKAASKPAHHSKPVTKKPAPAKVQPKKPVAPVKPAAKAPQKKGAVAKPVAKAAPAKPVAKAKSVVAVAAKKPAPVVKPAVKTAPAKPVAPVKPAAPVAKPVAVAPAKKGAPDPSSLVSIKPKVQPVTKKEPQRATKLVIPKTSTKSAVKYEPDFTKSVLDSRPAPAPVGPTQRYSDADLVEFREIIMRKLDAAKKELAYLQGLITRKDQGGDMDDARYMTMEDGSVSMEREQLSQMASRQITFIDHLEKAMMRIENKTYGICRVTGKLIDKARLRAVPHATLSIEAKQMMNK